jgi:hypothetical protein
MLDRRCDMPLKVAMSPSRRVITPIEALCLVIFWTNQFAIVTFTGTASQKLSSNDSARVNNTWNKTHYYISTFIPQDKSVVYNLGREY